MTRRNKSLHNKIFAVQCLLFDDYIGNVTITRIYHWKYKLSFGAHALHSDLLCKISKHFENSTCKFNIHIQDTELVMEIFL